MPASEHTSRSSSVKSSAKSASSDIDQDQHQGEKNGISTKESESPLRKHAKLLSEYQNLTHEGIQSMLDGNKDQFFQRLNQATNLLSVICELCCEHNKYSQTGQVITPKMITQRESRSDCKRVAISHIPGLDFSTPVVELPDEPDEVDLKLDENIEYFQNFDPCNYNDLGDEFSPAEWMARNMGQDWCDQLADALGEKRSTDFIPPLPRSEEDFQLISKSVVMIENGCSIDDNDVDSVLESDVDISASGNRDLLLKHAEKMVDLVLSHSRRYMACNEQLSCTIRSNLEWPPMTDLRTSFIDAFIAQEHLKLINEFSRLITNTLSQLPELSSSPRSIAPDEPKEGQSSPLRLDDQSSPIEQKYQASPIENNTSEVMTGPFDNHNTDQELGVEMSEVLKKGKKEQKKKRKIESDEGTEKPKKTKVEEDSMAL